MPKETTPIGQHAKRIFEQGPEAVSLQMKLPAMLVAGKGYTAF